MQRHAQLVGSDPRQHTLGFGRATRPGQRRRGELQIFQYGQIGRQRRMLIHHRYAVLAHSARVGRVDMLAAVIDGASIGVQHAGGNSDQRRLAGAVLADDGVDLAGINEDVDAFERLHRTEALAQAGERHHRDVRRGGLQSGGFHDVMHDAAAG